MADRCDQGDNEYFRIFALDEAYELNRSNFRDENSKLFKDDMRTARKMQGFITVNSKTVLCLACGNYHKINKKAKNFICTNYTGVKYG